MKVLFNKIEYVLEIIGSLCLLSMTSISCYKVKHYDTTIDGIGDSVGFLLGEIKSQFTAQMISFGFLLAGFLIQTFKSGKHNK